MASLEQTTDKPELTRDRIVGLLLKHPSTIASLAESLGVTHNAVRSQIALLEREGLVTVQGTEKGTRRPAAVYGIRPGAEVRPSRAYPIAFSELIQVLSKKLSKIEFSSVMRQLGKRVAREAPKTAGDPRARVDGALKFLRVLGSAADVTEENGKITVSSHGCPIARAVRADVRSCLAMESLLKELTGLPVTERCEHGANPSCRFEIKLSAGK